MRAPCQPSQRSFSEVFGGSPLTFGRELSLSQELFDRKREVSRAKGEPPADLLDPLTWVLGDVSVKLSHEGAQLLWLALHALGTTSDAARHSRFIAPRRHYAAAEQRVDGFERRALNQNSYLFDECINGFAKRSLRARHHVLLRRAKQSCQR